jgi:hypothetical protein
VAGDVGLDLVRLEAMLDVFERYLTSGELYRKVTVDRPDGRHELVTLSIGVLLDLADSLGRQAHDASGAEADTMRADLARFDALRTANADAYGRKLHRELRSNLDAWRWFVDDCRTGTAECIDDYPSEVRKRLRMEGLVAECERRRVAIDAELGELAKLDDELREVFEADSNAYCGPRGEAGRYPEPRFWWLYGRPRRTDS